MEHEKNWLDGGYVLKVLFGISNPLSRSTFNIFIPSILFSFFLLEFLTYQENSLFNSPNIFENLNKKFEKDFLFGFMTLPFIFSTLSLSICRSIDTGRSPWWGFLILLPGVNIVLVAVLAYLPSHPNPNWHIKIVNELPEDFDKSWSKTRAQSLIGLIIISAIVIILQTMLLKSYSFVFFISIPFVIGVLAGYIRNDEKKPIGLAKTARSTIVVLITVGVVLLTLSVYGLICLAMALPIALPFALLGGVYGRAIAIRWWPRESSHLLLLLFLLCGHILMSFLPNTEQWVEIKTTMIIEAPPAKVWKYVPEMKSLPSPDESWFKIGVAYPTHARLQGTGVGAKRFCEFSSGTMEETITEWEENRRLTFAITKQPYMMKQASWGSSIRPEELNNFIKSKRGEFRLIPLPDGSTRLEGTSWLSVDIHPHSYWRLIVDPVVHAIHNRVFRHIKQQAESDKTPSSIEHIPIQVATK